MNQTIETNIKIIPIGNSKGIRLPKSILQKYGFGDTLILEEAETGVLLRNKDAAKLSWADTYREMAEEKEDWDDFDHTLLDGGEDEAF